MDADELGKLRRTREEEEEYDDLLQEEKRREEKRSGDNASTRLHSGEENPEFWSSQPGAITRGRSTCQLTTRIVSWPLDLSSKEGEKRSIWVATSYLFIYLPTL
jgi:hypothetical protein